MFDAGRTIVQRWRTIAMVALVTTSLATGSTMFSQPGFVVNGTMYLGDTQGNPGGVDDPASTANFIDGFAINTDVETDIDLLRSRALVEQAIEETGLNATVTQTGGDKLPYWRWHYLNHSAISAFAPKPTDLVARFATLDEAVSNTVSYTLTFSAAGVYQISSPGGWLRKPTMILTGTLNKPAAGGGLSLLLQPTVDGFIPDAGADALGVRADGFGGFGGGDDFADGDGEFFAHEGIVAGARTGDRSAIQEVVEPPMNLRQSRMQT